MRNLLKKFINLFSIFLIKKKKIDYDILEIVEITNTKISRMPQTYVLDDYSFTSERIRKDDGYENNIQNLIVKIIPALTQDGSSVIDIGSNIGAHSTLLSKLVSDKSTVFCFEPVKYNIERLQLNALLSGVNNIEIYPFAVGDENTNIIFNEVDEMHYETGMSRFNNEELLTGQIPFTKKEIKQVALDDFFNSKNERISFIKIDVEGYESCVLKGMQQLIKKNYPVIIMEYHTSRMKNFFESKEYLNYFSNYNLYEILKEQNGKFFLKKFDFIRHIRGDLICMPKNFKIK